MSSFIGRLGVPVLLPTIRLPELTHCEPVPSTKTRLLVVVPSPMIAPLHCTVPPPVIERVPLPSLPRVMLPVLIQREPAPSTVTFETPLLLPRAMNAEVPNTAPPDVMFIVALPWLPTVSSNRLVHDDPAPVTSTHPLPLDRAPSVGSTPLHESVAPPEMRRVPAPALPMVGFPKVVVDPGVESKIVPLEPAFRPTTTVSACAVALLMNVPAPLLPMNMIGGPTSLLTP